VAAKRRERAEAVVPQVLILSAPYGAGHDRVAAALARALAAEGARVETLDHFVRFVSPAFARLSGRLFWLILQRAPWLWGRAYDLSARLPTRSPAMLGMGRLGARRLERYLAASRPDVVAHVHATSAGAMAWLRERGRTRIPHAVVLTDFAAHPQWIFPGIDRYFVPTESVRDALVARGVAADRVVASGLPIDPAFAAPPDRARLRRDLGVPAGAPVVLVMGGMQGRLGGIAEVCAVLAERSGPLHALVVCGEHGALQAALTARYGEDRRFQIFGRVDDVHRLMGAADLVVTKAGASTCAEALALERPLVFYRSLPGQEAANERCILAARAGLRASGPRPLGALLDALLDEPAARGVLSTASRRVRRPDAARAVAKELLALAAESRKADRAGEAGAGQPGSPG
jgi:processive 1,2-diacylglycerol beta-glucosyltransferase